MSIDAIIADLLAKEHQRDLRGRRNPRSRR